MRYILYKMADVNKHVPCVCHVVEIENEQIRPFSDASCAKLLDCVDKWKTLDGIECFIASNFKPDCKEGGGFHRKCYQRFTDKCRIAQAEKRIENGRPRSVHNPEAHEVNTTSSTSDIDEYSQPSVKRRLRSETGSTDISCVHRRSLHVLPPLCLICKDANKRVYNKIAGKREVEALTTCETDGRSLIQAAEQKNDENLLVHIRGKDLVSIELRYHKSCYRNYTRCLSNKYRKKSEEDMNIMYAPSFKIFCMEIVEGRIINGGEVLRITIMKNLFVKIVGDTENCDASHYRNSALKNRLLKKYGDKLQFIRPHIRECELVLAHRSGSASHVLNIITTQSDTSDSESEEDEQVEQAFPVEQTVPVKLVVQTSNTDLRDIYHAAMQLHGIIESSKGVTKWPPRAEDLTSKHCKEVVPVELFNFLAWCTGITNVFCSGDYVKVSQDVQKKLLSIGQDLIYLASQGRKLTPKHVALGLAVRHLTGSSQLIGLLNGLGHSISHSLVLQHDTALALQQLQGDGIPPGFHEGVFTTIVWDNNDFGEETLTGEHFKKKKF